jgi:hypothetical protein
MSQFEDIFKKEVLEEESRVEKKRVFYPRKIKKAGGFDPKFIDCLGEELKRLQSLDETITISHILKSLDFEVKKSSKGTNL